MRTLTALLSSLTICLTFNAVVSQQLATIWGASLEDQGTTQILSATAAYSPIQVDDSITDYQVIEVDSLLVVIGVSGTQTLLSTPTTHTYTIQRGASFYGNTIFETNLRVPSPGTTVAVVDIGYAACEPSQGVTPTEGIEVQCLEIVSESVVDGLVAVVTTVGYNGHLYPLATITAPSAIRTVSSPSSTVTSSTPFPTPSPAFSPSAPPGPAAPISQITVYPSSVSASKKMISTPWSLLTMATFCSFAMLKL